MYLDWRAIAAFALGAGAGVLATLFATLPMLRRAWVSYQHERNYEQAERVAAIVKDILQTRSAPDADELHPLKAAASIEEQYWEAQRHAREANEYVDRVRHMLNYKAGKP